MLSFRLFLESSYKAKENESQVLYHVSSSDKNFKRFKPMSHFGTAGAARAIGDTVDNENKPKLSSYTVRLKLGNVHTLPDDHDHDLQDHNPRSIASALHSQKIMSDAEHKDKSITKSHHTLAKFLRSKNIQSLKYKNNVEGGDSYIITHPDQVRILKQSKKGKAVINTSRKTEPPSYHVSDNENAIHNLYHSLFGKD